jgi:ABC-type multidrug transport system permease subunit
MLFVGFAFDSSGIQGISVGVYSNSSSSLETEIVTGLSNQGFIVSSFNYSQNCIESIKLNEIQVCLVFPEGFSDTGSVDEVKIYVDSSRINLAYSVLHEIENQVSNSSSILGTSLAGNLINTLNSVKTTLNEDKSKLDESIDNSKVIDLITSKFDETFEMEEELSNLRLIKSKLNSSSDISKIDSVISKIEDLDDYLSSSSSGFYQISKYNDESSEMFDNVISDIDKLTKEISSSNVFEAETISSPVKTEIVYVNGEENNLDYMLPTIISLIALFGGILLSASFILKERKTKAYFRNFMTPTINFTFLFADYATCLLVLMCQFILVFLGIYFIFGISIPIHYGEFFVLILLSLSVFILLELLSVICLNLKRQLFLLQFLLLL